MFHIGVLLTNETENRHHQRRFPIYANALAAGVPPRTPLREFIALPRRLAVFFGWGQKEGGAEKQWDMGGE